MNLFAVILAGGKGERLWPASTPHRPKPFLPLAPGGRSLLRASYERVVPLTGPEGVLAVVARELAGRVGRVLQLPPSQVIQEPSGRNTAPAIGLAACALAARDPQAVMIVLPADHLVSREEEFRGVLSRAVKIARTGHLVTLGVPPDRPAVGYGYIRPADPLAEGGFRVAQFLEKPDAATAQKFVSQGYLWNAGIFVWTVAGILEEIDRHLPGLSTALRRLRPLAGTPEWTAVLDEVWPQVEAISVDYGVMEKAGRVAVVPAEVGWTDVGDWQAAWQVMEKDAHGLAVYGEKVARDTTNALIWGWGGKPVAALGVEGLAVVEGPDAVLVADLSRSQQVRELARLARPVPREVDQLLAEDRSGMVRVVQEFPGQCRQALTAGEAVQLPEELAGFSRIVCVGMGGSGITGDLLARLLPVEVIACRSYRLPRHVGQESLLVGVSYSGNTEETLTAFADGLARTSRAVGISSGGRLAELCRRRRIPWIQIPAGFQPRAALGHLLFTLVGALGKLGADPVNPAKALAVLAAQARELGPERPDNPALALAQELHGRVPLIYGAAGRTAPVALRWKTQVNENAKQPAFWAELPEACHNEIVGYELTGRIFPQASVLFLRTAHDHPRIGDRVEVLKEVLERRELPYHEVWGRGEGEVAQLFSLLYLGDWVSLYLALLNRTDPTPVRPIEELKERLAQLPWEGQGA
ncbi:MAG: bifunctional phosphoglucose/phosphomannose isomerase [Candidatus Bipolaricaulaceae bacterium]